MPQALSTDTAQWNGTPVMDADRWPTFGPFHGPQSNGCEKPQQGDPAGRTCTGHSQCSKASSSCSRYSILLYWSHYLISKSWTVKDWKQASKIPVQHSSKWTFNSGEYLIAQCGKQGRLESINSISLGWEDPYINSLLWPLKYFFLFFFLMSFLSTSVFTDIKTS